MDVYTLVAFGFLVAGVFFSLYPRVPGAVLSLFGVLLYWWQTGFTEPATGLVLLLTGVATVAVGSQLYAVYTKTRRRASRRVVTLSGVVGAIGFALLGAVGLLLGTLGTVFLLEYRRHRSVKRGFITVVRVMLGSLAARLLQLLLTGIILVVMLAVVFF